MLAVDFVNVAVVISGILVLCAAVLTLVLWQEEGRRAANLGRAQNRHTALAQPDAPADGDDDKAELSA